MPKQPGSDFDRFIRELKVVVDSYNAQPYESHGPLRIENRSGRGVKRETRYITQIESGWDENYGGRITVDSSKTGRSLTVYVSPEVKVVRQDD